MASTSRPALAHPASYASKMAIFWACFWPVFKQFRRAPLNSERVDDHLLRSQIASKRFQISSMVD